MSTFSSEWVTIKGPYNNHRVLLESRDSHPKEEHRFMAEIAARVLDVSGANFARVTHVFGDERNGAIFLTMASTDPNDHAFANTVRSTLESLCFNPPEVLLELVKNGDELRDSYDHMRHLSESSI